MSPSLLRCWLRYLLLPHTSPLSNTTYINTATQRAYWLVPCSKSLSCSYGHSCSASSSWCPPSHLLTLTWITTGVSASFGGARCWHSRFLLLALVRPSASSISLYILGQSVSYWQVPKGHTSVWWQYASLKQSKLLETIEPVINFIHAALISGWSLCLTDGDGAAAREAGIWQKASNHPSAAHASSL